MDDLADGYNVLGRHADALKLREERLKLYTAVVDVNEDLTDAATLENLNNVAWALATCPDATLRDPQRAVKLAIRAVDGAPESPYYLNTLGTARFRAEDWNGAIADLEKSIDLFQPDDPRNAYNGFVLAMAYWKIEEKDRAREWFDKAVIWMDKGQKENAQMQRFQAEAATLLGIAGPPPKPEAETGTRDDEKQCERRGPRGVGAAEPVSRVGYVHHSLGSPRRRDADAAGSAGADKQWWAQPTLLTRTAAGSLHRLGRRARRGSPPTPAGPSCQPGRPGSPGGMLPGPPRPSSALQSAERMLIRTLFSGGWNTPPCTQQSRV
jgi:hypothetical protein